MCRAEIRLVLLALVLCQAPLGPATPVPVGGGTVLAKMYPRGNHWAVGHLMGKKSTGESPPVLEGDSLQEHRREDIQWEEATRNLLGFMEVKGNRSYRSPQLKPPSDHQLTWDTEDSSNLKDLVEYVLHILKGKEGASS
ncbi:gastrin-releasing peptide [Octodon degus]|uniref:Gastrin-releasing peptide n=1 Tax=Octodon degus TaxID=10160 RepID=A0A6P3FY46_OCTDE|nr:gastrin-releasing peptide [Octodon degus]